MQLVCSETRSASLERRPLTWAVGRTRPSRASLVRPVAATSPTRAKGSATGTTSTVNFGSVNSSSTARGVGWHGH
jgi:hypothetical protein